MQITITRRMAVTVVAVLALVGAGGAVAASGHSKLEHRREERRLSGPPAAPARAPTSPPPSRATSAITKAELKTARDNGTSLAQLATQQGKSVAGLKDAIYADAKAHLDKDVAAGKLTAAQETSMLSEPPVAPRRHGQRHRPAAARASAGRVARPLGTGAATLGRWPLPSGVTTSSSSTSSPSPSAGTASRG